MLYLLLSIISSVSVGILFKKIKPTFTQGFFMISINYLIGTFLLVFLFDFNFSNYDFNYFLIAPLTILMPTIFYILNLSIKKSGIIKTDIAQRISLIIPITAAFFIFNESISLFKWFGIIFGFIAVFLMLYKSDRNIKKNSFYLLLVFLGYGIIDVLFKQIALQNTHPYTTYLLFIFIGAFIVSLFISLFLKKDNKKITLNYYLYGSILGLLNFSNIYFYLKAHIIFFKEPSTVFAVMNFGVISLATIVGVFFFNEKLTKKNIIGVFLAILAVLFILFAQFKNI